MADVVISFAVQNIIPILQEKLREAGEVETDVENIRYELDRMTAFLKDADSVMEDRDERKENWVKEVRNVAHDTEDVLDKFVLMMKNNQGSGWSNTVLQNFLNCAGNIRFRSDIVSEIKSINTRVNSIKDGCQKYFGLAGGSNSNVDASIDVAYDTRRDALWEEADLVGIEGPKGNLMRKIMEGGLDLRVISVVGTVGVGKSALVKKVYDDAAVKKSFQSHACVAVPQALSDKTNIEELLEDLIKQLYRETMEAVPPEMNTKNKNNLKAGINQFLQQKRYVILFDDVRSILEWNAIKSAFPDHSNGSRLIVTTRDNAVASYSSVMEENVCRLEPLAPKHSLTLFCQQTFQGRPCPSHLEKITNNILQRCGGLPLAIKSIGAFLASKSNRPDEWDVLYQSLGAELAGTQTLRNLNTILLLSFNDLPYYLKLCLLYMAIYPEYHLIKYNSLIRLWIVEGFVNEIGGQTVEQVAQGYLKELANKNLIRVVKSKENGNIKSCRINYFLREKLLQKAKRQSFLMIVGKNSNGRWDKNARRLSIHGSWENFNPQMSGKKLRSLLAFGVTDLKSMSSILELLKSCTMLKVLDLSGLPLESFPKVITKLLLLKHLYLRRTKIKSIPRSIKKLQELEALDLKHSLVTELPIEILQLQKLRHLVISRYEGYVEHSYAPMEKFLGFKLPNGIEALNSLYQLAFIEAIPGIIEEIGNIKELRRLFIFKLGREHGMMVCSSIEKLPNLQSLALFPKTENEILDLDHISSPPASLQELSVSGRLEKFPHWIKSLDNLVKVYFRWSRLRDDPLQYLQDLPSLVRLEILDGYVGEELCFKAGKFQSLKKLYLDTFESLKQVIIEEGAMPNLKRIKIQRCKSLESVPSGIECLPKVEVLKLFYMSPEFIEKLSREDNHKIAHIFKVLLKDDVKKTEDD
ncbi:disease resistance protein RPM1-like [Olea europaea var. sylvestris]|uniref:disease resistance protein RPM1-like n=1 Tax=Olea europaea var. sylvestris TaxID=158386 RepID=UPI000C1D6681|nr:disease resistance protein RPM1-like [Olea europaea var. sylvestris]